MEINKEFYKNVKTFVQKQRQNHSKDYDIELEAVYASNITKDAFDRCISYYQNDEEDYEFIQQDDNLDITVKETNQRVTLQGRDCISKYCETNTVNEETAMVIKKTREFDPLFFSEIDFKINLKKEEKTDKKILEKMFMMDKSFRFKKRYSFLNKKEGVRIDMTIVKQSSGFFKDFKESKLMKKPDQYEVEIEIINKIKDQDTLVTDFLNQMLNIYSLINEEDYVCLKSEKKSAINDYFNLCFQKIPNDYEIQPKKYFCGPQPITLERKNIIEPKLGTISIQEDYTVTEKADGERQLMFVDSNGKIWLINNRLNIRFTGVKIPLLSNSLFDGELITTNIIGDPMKHFAIFDSYYYKGKDVRSLKLVDKEGRISIAKEFMKTCVKPFKDIDFEITVKEFMYGTDIFKNCAEILKRNQLKQYNYRVDGLIFTPMNLPVGASYSGDTTVKSIGTWNAVFKWKPPEDNTIDFLVKFKRGSSNNPQVTFIDSQAYRILDLYVGCDPAKLNKLTSLNFLKNPIITKHSYMPLKFIPPGYDESAVCYVSLNSKNNIDIEDNSIVEFKYETESESWKPIRIRKDKTDMYRKTNSLSGAVNDIQSALNVWNTIKYPITEANITGDYKTLILPDEDDIYYDRKGVDRKSLASKAILEFHNKGVKSVMLKEYKGDNKFLLDLACGKGGDVGKYLDIGYKKVLGIDSNRDNIENPNDGVYARLLSKLAIRKYKPDSMQYVFLTADLSEKISPSSFVEDDKHVASVIYGITKDNTLEKYYNMINKNVDIVTCQFAIHYFFQNQKTLDNFLYNLDNNMREGGLFMGTCLDGKEVKNILKGKTFAEGVANKRVLWNIKKLYEKDTGVDFGESIEVYMESIGRVFKEYLVNFDTLTKMLNSIGYELVAKKNLKEYYDSQDKTDKIELSDIEKQYSFLNIAFVFRKRSNSKRVLIKKIKKEEAI